MQKVIIRRAELSDMDWINSKYNEVGFVTSGFENEYIVIAKVENENAGLGRLVVLDNDHVELGGIYVFPDFRRLGVAETVVRSLCDENPFSASTIWCLPFENLLSFYAKFEFKYCDGTNAPVEIIKKLAWCNSGNKYEEKVILLCKKK